MAATLYLAGSIFILIVGATSWFQARRIGPLVPVYFFSGWLAGEPPLPGHPHRALVARVLLLGLARERARAPVHRDRRARDARVRGVRRVRRAARAGRSGARGRR